jgi:hypothetical protein
MMGLLANDGLEGMSEGIVVRQFKVPYQHLSGRAEENLEERSVVIIGFRAEI